MKKGNNIYVFFVIPALILYVVFFISPVIQSMYYSFTDLYGYNKEINFIGISNYLEAFNDNSFIRALITSLKYTLFSTTIGICLSIILAIILDNDKIKVSPFRAVFFLPTIMSLVIVSYIWTFVYGNVYRNIVEILNIPEVLQFSWLGDEKIAIYSVALVAVWQGAGTAMIIFLAALQNVSTDVLESASIDGATAIDKIFKIKLPLILPIIFMQTILSISGNLRAFTNIFAMTSGGPGGSTQTVVFLVYRLFTDSRRSGYAMAISMILLVIIATLSVFLNKLMKKAEEKIL